MVWARLANWWENVRTSLWFVPTVCVLVAALLSIILPRVDQHLSQGQMIDAGLFAGDANAARAILSVIAASLITVVALVFSITIVVLEQAATQYTPRIIGNFTRYTANQLVLGMFLATFIYALLVLRQVRGDRNIAGEFVPSLSVTVAIVLAGICVGLLVYFIHHTAISLQAPSVSLKIQAHLLEAVEHVYPEEVGRPLDGDDDSLDSFRRRHPNGPIITLTAQAAGFLRLVDDDAILDAIGNQRAWVIIHPQVGQYIIRGDLLLELGGTSGLTDEQVDLLRSAFVLDRERSYYQDPLFSIRQLVDIALKALSPAIQDPTTAEYALAHLSDALAVLAGRSVPSRIRLVEQEENGQHIAFWINRPTFADFVDGAFSQIRRAAQHDFHVTAYLLECLSAVGRCTRDLARLQPLQVQIDEVLDRLDEAPFSPAERENLRARALAARGVVQV